MNERQVAEFIKRYVEEDNEDKSLIAAPMRRNDELIKNCNMELLKFECNQLGIFCIPANEANAPKRLKKIFNKEWEEHQSYLFYTKDSILNN